jgi:DNA-binding CsgD family transcriptional regulator
MVQSQRRGKMAPLRQTSRPSALRADLQDLSDRERSVLGLICQGQTNLDMSESLKLSHNTIRNHLASLYRKIGVNRGIVPLDVEIGEAALLALSR